MEGKGDNRVGGGECKQAFSCLVNSLINLENKQLVLTEALHSWSLIQLPPHHPLLSFFAIHRNFGRHQRVLNRLCLVKHFSCLYYLVITNYLQLLVSTKKKLTPIISSDAGFFLINDISETYFNYRVISHPAKNCTCTQQIKKVSGGTWHTLVKLLST